MVLTRVYTAHFVCAEHDEADVKLLLDFTCDAFLSLMSFSCDTLGTIAWGPFHLDRKRRRQTCVGATCQRLRISGTCTCHCRMAHLRSLAQVRKGTCGQQCCEQRQWLL